MQLKLKGKTWAVFGYKESGKSFLAKFIASQYGEKCLYYDTLHEVAAEANFHSYPPKNRQNVMELVSIILLLKNSRKYRMLIIDEANRFCRPKPTPLPQEIADMNDWCRHPQYNLSVGYIARRPVQLNTDITEICDYLFVFQLGGNNDIKYLNELRAGLGDTVKNLPKFHFCLVNPDRTWETVKPIIPHKI